MWEQVTPQTARGFVGISTTGGGEKQGVVYRFLLPGEGMEEAVSLGFSELPLCHLMKSAKVGRRRGGGTEKCPPSRWGRG